MSGGARFGDGARFGGGARFDIDHVFFLFVGPACSKTFAVGIYYRYKGLLLYHTLFNTFLVSIPFWKGPCLDSFSRGPLR